MCVLPLLAVGYFQCEDGESRTANSIVSRRLGRSTLLLAILQARAMWPGKRRDANVIGGRGEDNQCPTLGGIRMRTT